VYGKSNLPVSFISVTVTEGTLPFLRVRVRVRVRVTLEGLGVCSHTWGTWRD